MVLLLLLGRTVPALTTPGLWGLKRVPSNWAQTPPKPKRCQSATQPSPQPPYERLGERRKELWSHWFLWGVPCLWWEEILSYEASFKDAGGAPKFTSKAGCTYKTRWLTFHSPLDICLRRECAPLSCACASRAERTGEAEGRWGVACVCRKCLGNK